MYARLVLWAIRGLVLLLRIDPRVCLGCCSTIPSEGIQGLKLSRGVDLNYFPTEFD